MSFTESTANASTGFRTHLIQEANAQYAKDKSICLHGWKKITIKMNSIIIPASIDNKMRVIYVEKVSYNPRSRKLIQETIWNQKLEAHVHIQ